MGTVGTLTVDLNNFRDIFNNSTLIGAEVTGGISDQGDLIGLAIGIGIAFGILASVVLTFLAFVPNLIRNVKSMRG